MFFSGRFIKRFGSLRLIVFCLGSIACRSLIYVIFPTLTGAVIGQLPNSVTCGLFHPAAVSFVAANVPRKYLAVSMTLYSIAAAGAANVIGSLSGGFIIDILGYPALFLLFAVPPVTGTVIYIFLKQNLFSEKNG
jgi:PPP family 3-phenylpropionic acid transporter